MVLKLLNFKFDLVMRHWPFGLCFDLQGQNKQQVIKILFFPFTTHFRDSCSLLTCVNLIAVIVLSSSQSKQVWWFKQVLDDWRTTKWWPLEEFIQSLRPTFWSTTMRRRDVGAANLSGTSCIRASKTRHLWYYFFHLLISGLELGAWRISAEYL